MLTTFQLSDSTIDIRGFLIKLFLKLVQVEEAGVVNFFIKAGGASLSDTPCCSYMRGCARLNLGMCAEPLPSFLDQCLRVRTLTMVKTHLTFRQVVDQCT